MSPRLATAAALMALTGAIHVGMGGPEVYHPLLAATPDPVLTLYLALLWHFVTAFFALGALAFLWVAREPAGRGPVAVATAALMLAMGALFFGFGIVHLGEVWTAPQWLIAAAIAALALWPTRRPA